MPVIKKTVAIVPEMDEIIRKLWAILIEKGYDATYSTALNSLILGGWVAPEKLKGKEGQDFFDILNSFVNDPRIINEVNFADFESTYGKNIRVRQPKITTNTPKVTG